MIARASDPRAAGVAMLAHVLPMVRDDREAQVERRLLRRIEIVEAVRKA